MKYANVLKIMLLLMFLAGTASVYSGPVDPIQQVKDSDDDPTTATQISSPHTGDYAIDPEGDIDWYRVLLYAGSTYTFANSNSTIDTAFYLYGPGTETGTDIGALIEYCDDWNGVDPLIEFTPSAEGYYYLRVADWYNDVKVSKKAGKKSYTGKSTGVYTLSVTSTTNFITALLPNGGEVWMHGTTHDITWTDVLEENVNIHLYKAGEYHSTLASSVPSSGSFSWTVPDTITPSADYKIRIESVNSSDIFDESDYYACISGTDTVDILGQWQITVTWEKYDGTIDFLDNGTLYIVEDPYTTGTWELTGNGLRFEFDSYSVFYIGIVTGYTMAGTMANLEYDGTGTWTALMPPISIVSPNGGEVWQWGTSHDITWENTGSDNVNIQLYMQGVYNSTIASSVAGKGYYKWTVPDTVVPSADYKIRIESAVSSEIYDESEYYCCISNTDFVDITGKWMLDFLWDKGSAVMEFLSDGTFYFVDFPEDTGIWTLTGNGLRFDFDDFETYYIGNVNGNSMLGTMTDPVNIGTGTWTAQKMLVSVESPGGGEVWMHGTTHEIIWDDELTEDVYIDLYKAGTFYSTIAGPLSGKSSYEWTISDTITPDADYKIRVSSSVTAETYDESDFYICISGNQDVDIVGQWALDILWDKGKSSMYYLYDDFTFYDGYDYGVWQMTGNGVRLQYNAYDIYMIGIAAYESMAGTFVYEHADTGTWSASRYESLDGNDFSTKATPISVPHTGDYEINPEGDVDWYRIFLEVGNSYVFENTNSSVDGAFYLFGPGTEDGTDIGSFIDYSDDWSGYDPRIDYNPSAEGYYYLRIASYDNDYKSKELTIKKGTPKDVGSYTLNVTSEEHWMGSSITPLDVNVYLEAGSATTEIVTISAGSNDISYIGTIDFISKNSSPAEPVNIDFSKSDSHNSVSSTDDKITVKYAWDMQFSYDVYNLSGGILSQAGCESDGQYIYTTVWNTSDILKFSPDGTYIETFQISGVSELRDLAYDGTYFYGGANDYTIYKMDFTDKTLIGTITSPTIVRAIAYDSENDGFWVNNWDSDMVCVGRDGSAIDTITGIPSCYGAAYDNFNFSSGGPFLWLSTGTEDGYPATLEQFSIPNHAPTGFAFQVAETGIAGGCFIREDLIPGTVTVGILAQAEALYGYELGGNSMWLSLTDGTGDILAGATQNVTLNFDASNWAVTKEDIVKTAKIYFNDADGIQYPDPVNVTLTVHITGIEETALPAVTLLHQNYPNPFNPETTVSYDVAELSKVNLSVFNYKGELVNTLVNEQKAAGHYTAKWNCSDSNGNTATSGVYFISMKTENYSKVVKALMVK